MYTYSHLHSRTHPLSHLVNIPFTIPNSSLFSPSLPSLSTHLPHQAKPIVTDPSVLHPSLNGDNQEATHINLFMWIRVMLQQLQAEQIHRGAATKLMFESGERMRLSLHTHSLSATHTLSLPHPPFHPLSRNLAHLHTRLINTTSHLFSPIIFTLPPIHPYSNPAAAGALTHQVAIPPPSEGSTYNHNGSDTGSQTPAGEGDRGGGYHSSNAAAGGYVDRW